MNDRSRKISTGFTLLWGSCLSLLVLFQAFSVAFQPAALAQSESRIEMTAQAGFDSLCKDGAWIPVKISIENRGDSLDASIQIRSSGPNTIPTLYTQPISLPSISHKETFLYFQSENYQTEVEVRLIANRQVVTQATAPINCVSKNDRIFGLLSANPSSFNLLADLDPVNGRASIARLEIEDLPDRAPALQPLDYLIISDLDTGTLAERQIEALDGWISAGGELIVTGGADWQKTAAGIERLLPFYPDHSQLVSSFLGLPGDTILSAGELAPFAEVLIEQDGMPLLIRGRHGAGSVYYLAADPSLEPLKNWEDILTIYEQIVDARASLPVWAAGIQDWNSAGNAVSSLPELALPPFNLLCVFLFIYIAVLGPVNYLVLRRIKHKELAWISIPVLVVIFSLGAFLVGSGGRGKEPVISRLAVVQVWPDSTQAPVYGLSGIYSPNRATYHLEIDRNFLPHPLPDNPNQTPAGGWQFETSLDENTHIPEIRVDVGGINAIGLEGQIPSPDIQGNLTLEFSSQGIALAGEIRNNSDLTLRDAALLSPGDTYQAGDFGPGDSRSFRIGLTEQDRARYQAAPPAQNYLGGASFYPPYASGNNFITDLLGAGDYYRDQATYRRFSLLNAITGYSNPQGIGGGIYLAGWSDSSPLPLRLQGQPFRSSDTTLYFFALRPNISHASGPIVLTPGLFTWSILESGSGVFNPSPYDGYLEGGDFSIQYVLIQPIPYTHVKELTLHLKSYDRQGPTGFNQYLWDFDQSRWVLLPEANWGDTMIDHPERYIGANGEIRLRLEQPGNGAYLPIERADFSLEVEP